MPNRSVTHDQLALDDLRDHVNPLVGEHDSHAFTHRAGVVTNRDKLAITVDSHRNVASETEDAFRC
jgi:tRNA U38,U39,U40 pseudouridine synthase TruA